MTTHPAPDALRLVPEPRAIAEAPRDGTMLRLGVRYPEGASWTPLDDARESWTIGFNNFDNTGEDRWQVVGWCWSHDHLVEAADDVEVLGWLPFHGEAAAPAVQPAAGREEIARALDLLNEARNGGFFIGTDAGAKVEEAKDVLRDILAAISTPAQASGAWVFNAPHLASGLAAVAQASGEPVAGAKLAKAMWGIDLIPAHPPAQASETGGEAWRPIETAPKDGTEVLVLIREKVIRLGWYFKPSSRTEGWRDENGKSIQPTHWMRLPAPPALSAPQAAPGEGEQS